MARIVGRGIQKAIKTTSVLHLTTASKRSILSVFENVSIESSLIFGRVPIMQRVTILLGAYYP